MKLTEEQQKQHELDLLLERSNDIRKLIGNSIKKQKLFCEIMISTASICTDFIRNRKLRTEVYEKIYNTMDYDKYQ